MPQVRLNGKETINNKFILGEKYIRHIKLMGHLQALKNRFHDKFEK